MLKLKLQYFGHLMWRVDSLEKTLMLGGIGGRRRRGRQRMRWLDGITLTRWTWVWWTPGVGDGKGGPACCDSWGCKESDMTEWLNWTDLGPNRTPVLDESWIFLPLIPFPSHLPVLLLYYVVSPLSWVEKLTCKLSSLFFILWPLYKVCAVSVSVLILLLTGWTQVGKEPPWPRQGVLAWAWTLTRVHSTNSVTIPWIAFLVS